MAKDQNLTSTLYLGKLQHRNRIWLMPTTLTVCHWGSITASDGNGNWLKKANFYYWCLNTSLSLFVAFKLEEYDGRGWTRVVKVELAINANFTFSNQRTTAPVDFFLYVLERSARAYLTYSI